MYLAALKAFFARFLVCSIKICGEGGGAGGRAADQRGARAAAAARHLKLQRLGAGSEVLRDQAASRY